MNPTASSSSSLSPASPPLPPDAAGLSSPQEASPAVPEGPHEHGGPHESHGEHHDEHQGHHGGSQGHEGMAVAATLHCLVGCSVGEVTGMLLGALLGWGNLTTMGASILLAFFSGYLLSALPLVRGGYPWRRALALVAAADTLSIASMEGAENLLVALIPGALQATLLQPLFWGVMAFTLLVGFLVALPVNRALLKRGRGHAITHEALGHAHTMNNLPWVVGLCAFLLGGFVASLGSLLA